MNTVLSAIARHPIACSAAILAALLGVASPMLYHGDNLVFSHALYLNAEASPYWMYPSFLLSYPLCWLSRVCPWVNVYLLYVYLLLIGSAAAVLHASRNEDGHLHPMGLLGVVAALYILCGTPLRIEYSWVAFIAGGCGCLLIFKEGAPSRCRIFAGAALLTGAVLLRHDSCPGFLPFIGLALLYRLLPPKGGWRRLWRQERGCILATVWAVLLIAAAGLLQKPLSGQALQGEGDLYSVNNARMSFCDYTDRSGLDKTADYQAAGVDAATLQVLENDYFYLDDARMTADWWERIADIRRRGNAPYALDATFWRSLWNAAFGLRYVHLIAVLAALLCMLSCSGRQRLFPLLMLAAYAAGLLACCAKGRCYTPSAATLCCFCCAMMFAPAFKRREVGVKAARAGRWASLLLAIPLLIPLFNGDGLIPESVADVRLLTFLYPLPMVYPFCRDLQQHPQQKPLALLIPAVELLAMLALYAPQLAWGGGFRHIYAEPAGHENLVSYVQEHPQQIFLLPSYEYRRLAYPRTALLNPKAPYMPRVSEWGDWHAAAPYMQQYRRSLGLQNEYTDALREDVRLVLDDESRHGSRFGILLDYLRGHCGLDVAVEEEHRLSPTTAVYRLRAK